MTDPLPDGHYLAIHPTYAPLVIRRFQSKWLVSDDLAFYTAGTLLPIAGLETLQKDFADLRHAMEKLSQLVPEDHPKAPAT